MRRAALIATTLAAAIAFATGAAAQDGATLAKYEAALDGAMAKYPLKVKGGTSSCRMSVNDLTSAT